jgi:hypothetical protein
VVIPVTTPPALNRLAMQLGPRVVANAVIEIIAGSTLEGDIVRVLDKANGANFVI